MKIPKQLPFSNCKVGLFLSGISNDNIGVYWYSGGKLDFEADNLSYNISIIE